MANVNTRQTIGVAVAMQEVRKKGNVSPAAMWLRYIANHVGGFGRQSERDITSVVAGDASWGDCKKEGKAWVRKKKNSGQMGGWMDGWTGGWMDRWTDG